MEMLTDLAGIFLMQILSCLMTVFVVASIVLFIIDLSKAGKEKRKVKLWVKIMFIVSMILVASLTIGVLLLTFVIGFYMFE